MISYNTRIGYVTVAIVSVLAVFFAGVSSPGVEAAANPVVDAAATATDSSKSTVLNDPAAVQRGELRFAQNCVYCHGDRGSGGKAKPLQGRDFEADYVFKVITKGKKRGALVMPPWSRSMDEVQRWELVAYIMSLSEKTDL